MCRNKLSLIQREETGRLVLCIYDIPNIQDNHGIITMPLLIQDTQ